MNTRAKKIFVFHHLIPFLNLLSCKLLNYYYYWLQQIVNTCQRMLISTCLRFHALMSISVAHTGRRLVNVREILAIWVPGRKFIKITKNLIEINWLLGAVQVAIFVNRIMTMSQVHSWSEFIFLLSLTKVMSFKDCADHHHKCRAWAARGECTRNRLWMEENCRLTCTNCYAHRSIVCGGGFREIPQKYSAQQQVLILQASFMKHKSLK